jgi:ABC-type transport system substrate-binding protein
MEELDELLAQQAVTADVPTRQQMYSEIASIMHEEMFWMGVRTDEDFWAVNNRLQDVRVSGIDAFWHSWGWDVY